MSNAQRVAEALTMASANGSTNRTIVVALVGTNDEPDANDDSGASFNIVSALAYGSESL